MPKTQLCVVPQSMFRLAAVLCRYQGHLFVRVDNALRLMAYGLTLWWLAGRLSIVVGDTHTRKQWRRGTKSGSATFEVNPELFEKPKYHVWRQSALRCDLRRAHTQQSCMCVRLGRFKHGQGFRKACWIIPYQILMGGGIAGGLLGDRQGEASWAMRHFRGKQQELHTRAPLVECMDDNTCKLALQSFANKFFVRACRPVRLRVRGAVLARTEWSATTSTMTTSCRSCASTAPCCTRTRWRR